MPKRVRRLWTEQPGLFRGYAGDLALAALFGALIVAGGRERTGAAAWSVINANGGPTLWGLLLLGGALSLVAAPWLTAATAARVLWGLGFLYMVIGLGFGYAYLTDGRSSPAGALLCLYVAYTHLSRAQVYKDGPTEWTA